MSLIEDEKEIEYQNKITMRKHNLIDNIDDLGLTDKKKKEFIKYYYLHLDDMNLLEALDEFKKL